MKSKSEDAPFFFDTGGLVILIIGLWWAAKPFISVDYHDGLLYAADALRLLHPDRFEHDLFFHSKTQGNFSIFPWLYSGLIESWGLKPAALGMVIMARTVWVGALLLLARSLRGGVFYLWAVGAMLLLPAGYDSPLAFHYGEAIPTPRCWAEAFGMLALAAYLQQRHVGAACLWVISAAFHPLMALPVGLLLVMMHRFRWGIIAMACGLCLGAAYGGLVPFVGIFQNFDDTWWQLVLSRNGSVLIQNWRVEWWLKPVVLWVLLHLIATTDAREPIRKLAKALAMTLVVCMALWLLACWQRNVLLCQLQLWRVLWLVQLLAPALWISGLKPWRDWDRIDVAHVMAVVTALLGSIWVLNLLIWPAWLLTLPRVREKLQHPMALRWLPIGFGALFLMMIPEKWAIFRTMSQLHAVRDVPGADGVAAASEFLMAAVIVLGIARCIVLARRFSPSLAMGVGWGSAGLVLAFNAWVMSHQIQRATEPLPDVQALQTMIPEKSVVYWSQGHYAAWLYLQRSSYASHRQGAGVMFSRESAVLLAERLGRLRAIGFENVDRGWVIPPVSWGEDVPEGPRSLCADSALDFVIVPEELPDADAIVPSTVSKEFTALSVFRCKPAA
jgi:hypothetical protein